MKSALLIALSCAAFASGAVAQVQPPAQNCVPDNGMTAGNNPPGSRSGEPQPNLSNRLADSNGVLCPPATGDADMRVNPPGGGRLKVVPPPGSPGGDPTVQPK